MTDCITDNVKTVILGGSSYTATITPKDGYKILKIYVTMGGIKQEVTGNTINILKVIGDIEVTAVAYEETLLYYWDFTDSLTDKINGAVATLSSKASQSKDGLKLGSGTSITYAYCTLGDILSVGNGVSIELDIGDLSTWSTTNGTCILSFKNLITSTVFGFSYKSKWAIYKTGGWKIAVETITDKLFFSNSRLKLTIDANGNVLVYKNNELVLHWASPQWDTADLSSITIGSILNSESVPGIYKSVKIYEGVKE